MTRIATTFVIHEMTGQSGLCAQTQRIPKQTLVKYISGTGMEVTQKCPKG